MNLFSQLKQITEKFSNFGQNKMLAVLGIGSLAFIFLFIAAIYLNKPEYQTLYTGLESDDVNAVSLALATANIPFSIGQDNASFKVPAGMMTRARMYLAERGLPNSATAGYELFDKVGSLGLTSFMQEVTKIRALEGEIARTIQSIKGIKAARVHIVLPDRGNFRRSNQKPTASVMLRVAGSQGRRNADSIRHLVAASVPGLSIDDVTVLDSTGQLLATGDDPSNSSLNRSLNVVQTVEREIEDNIEKALAPFLGLSNFRASVKAQVNTDAQEIQEVVYDPESRVERSVRVTRENKTSSKSTSDTPASVEQNLPQENGSGGGAGPKSNDIAERKEEQTNYEINSKTIATVKNSYKVEKISIAVVVNKGRILDALGENATDDDVQKYLAEISKVVSSAAGINKDRGDDYSLSMMDFLDSELLADGEGNTSIGDSVSQHVGSLINAGAFILVAFLIVWFGLRPLASALSQPNEAVLEAENGANDAIEDFTPTMNSGDMANDFGADFGFDSGEDVLAAGAPHGMPGLDMNDFPEVAGRGDIGGRVKEGPEKRLERMVEISDERVAKILRKWASEDAA